MTDLSNIVRIMPTMKSGDDLFSALEVLPEYDKSICTADVPMRLMALSDLYRIYVPSQMSLEIYSKMYLALFGHCRRRVRNWLYSRRIRITKLLYSRSIVELWAVLTALRLLEHPVLAKVLLSAERLR